MLRVRNDGVPMVGFTWYSLTDQVDWDTALREENGHVNPLGLYDLDRKIRPVGRAYKQADRGLAARCCRRRAFACRCRCSMRLRERDDWPPGEGRDPLPPPPPPAVFTRHPFLVST